MVVRINSGIKGLGYVLHHLSPLLLMCDPADLGVYTDFHSPFGENHPAVLLFEYIPSGIGYSKAIYDRDTELWSKALDLVKNCSCRDGCPSCIGPGGEKGSGGKIETLALLDQICKS